MPLTPALPEEFEAAQIYLRSEVRVPKTEARNAALAADIMEHSDFSYRGTRYRTPPLSYQLGVQLQEIQLILRTVAQFEESPEFKDLSDERRQQYMETLLGTYERAILLFWKASYPLAFWKRWKHKRTNPFTDCSSSEIVELLSFFFTCRMKSRVIIQGGLATRPSLTMLTQQMT